MSFKQVLFEQSTFYFQLKQMESLAVIYKRSLYALMHLSWYSISYVIAADIIIIL